MTDSVHQALESLSSILKSKQHPRELAQPEWGDDNSLRNICGSHRDLVVDTNQVDLGEYLHASEVGREVLNVRYWIPVRYCGIIETPVISTLQ